MDVLEACAKIMAERGYFIIASTRQYMIGEQTTGLTEGLHGDLVQPFRVVRETTFADFLGQCRVCGDDSEALPSDVEFFYVVATD